MVGVVWFEGDAVRNDDGVRLREDDAVDDVLLQRIGVGEVPLRAERGPGVVHRLRGPAGVAAAARRIDREGDGLGGGLALVGRNRDRARVGAVGEVRDLERGRGRGLVRERRHRGPAVQRVGDRVGRRGRTLVVRAQHDAGKGDRRVRAADGGGNRADRRRDDRRRSRADREGHRLLRRSLVLVGRDRHEARVVAVGEVPDVERRRGAGLVLERRHRGAAVERIGDGVGRRVRPLVVGAHHDAGERDRRGRAVHLGGRGSDRRPAALAEVADLDGVEDAPSGGTGILDRYVLRLARRIEDTDKRGAVLVDVAHGHRRKISGADQRIAPLVVSEELDEVAISGRQPLERDRQRACRVGPLPRVLQHRAEISGHALAARVAVRLGQIRRNRRIGRVEVGVRGEGDSVDRHRRDGVGVEECSIRTENGPFRIRCLAGPALLGGTAATAARRADRERDGLRGRLVLVGRDRDLAGVGTVGKVFDVE